MYLISNIFLCLYRIEEEVWDGSDISDDEDDLGQGVGPEFASVQMFLAATGTLGLNKNNLSIGAK